MSTQAERLLPNKEEQTSPAHSIVDWLSLASGMQQEQALIRSKSTTTDTPDTRMRTSLSRREQQKALAARQKKKI